MESHLIEQLLELPEWLPKYSMYYTVKMIKLRGQHSMRRNYLKRY